MPEISIMRTPLAVLVLVFVLVGATPAAMAAYDAGVETAQTRLIQAGFDPGPVDGLMGPRTRKAIRAFQRANGVPVSGRLDRATRSKLKAAAGEPPARSAVGEKEGEAPGSGGPEQAPAEVNLSPPEKAPGDEPRINIPTPPVDNGIALAPIEVASAKPRKTDGPPPAAVIVDDLISYSTLGWESPQGGPDALTRFLKHAGSPEMTRSAEELIVPRGDNIYVILAGETIPGFDCDPVKGSIEMELMLGVRGPIVFRTLTEKGYCKLGFGILLVIGQRLRMVRGDWGDTAIPSGTVEVGREGLRYISKN